MHWFTYGAQRIVALVRGWVRGCLAAADDDVPAARVTPTPPPTPRARDAMEHDTSMFLALVALVCLLIIFFA